MRLLIAAIALAFSGSVIGGTAEAAPPPFGSYLQTCNNVSFDGRTVQADCRKIGGGYRTTILDYGSCAPNAQIGNENGRMTCQARRGGTAVGEEVRRGPQNNDDNQGFDQPPNRPRPQFDEPPRRPWDRPDTNRNPPRGSYLRECEAIRFDGVMLNAICQRRNGEQVRTRLNIRECGRFSDIGVEHGQLVCYQ